ncbi:hypothetical protein JCM3765_004981 [Sporobolomyces pararoseus]
MVVCRYFNSPAGCYRGSACTFEHSDPNNPSSSSQSHSATTSQPWRDRGGQSTGRPSQQQAPRGTCREFWNAGSCSKFSSGSCRYQHTKSQQLIGPVQVSAFGALQPTSQRPTLDSPETLTSAAHGITSDALSPSSFSLRVDRAVLFKVAEDINYKFIDPSQVYPWVNSLYASSQVKARLSTHEESQNVLAAFANLDGPGMARLSEVLNFPLETNVGASVTTRSLSFQRGFMPLVFYLTSGEIRNSVFTHHLNRVYNVLHIHAPAWVSSTIKCLDSIMAEKTVKDAKLPARSPGFTPSNFIQIFEPLAQLLQEYFSRFPDAVVKVPQLQQLVARLSTHFSTYSEDVHSDSPSFDFQAFKDARQHRFIVQGVRKSVDTLLKVTERTQVVPFVADIPKSVSTSLPSAAALAALKRLFEPPGALRTGGARHDNDKSSIKDIQILPTHEELLSPHPAFVPANLPDGPHHLPPGSMDRQLDTIFRLLREDFVGPLRAAVSSIFHDLEDLQDPRNALGNLLRREGGRYRAHSSIHADSSDLNIYAGVEFAGVSLSEHHELQLTLELDFPAHFGRSHVVRHLAYGNLVGLICRRIGSRGGGEGFNPQDVRIFLGLVTSEASGPRGQRKQVGITFFEGELYLEALRQFEAQKKGRTDHGEMICFEVPGFLLGTLQPFLKALQSIEPATIPFAKYLSALPPPADSPITIDAPLFARTPGFTYDLSGSLKENSPPGTLLLNIQDQDSVEAARQIMTESSKLDPSQVDAMIDSLSREVALVRGPPGTGKSFLGVELIRALLDAKVGRILILSYTNHALDTMLRHLKEQVTDKIIRAGSRSKDPAMEQYSLKQLSFEQDRFQGRTNTEMRDLLDERKNLQKSINAVCELATRIARHQVHFEHLADYLRIEFPLHLEYFQEVPSSVIAASEELVSDEWETVGKKNRGVLRSNTIPRGQSQIFAWWRDGGDITLLEQAQEERDAETEALARQQEELARQISNKFEILPLDQTGSDSSSDSGSYSDYDGLGDLFEDAHIECGGGGEGDSEGEEEEEEEEERYTAPSRNRPVSELENDFEVWNFSREERARIVEAWADDLVAKEGPHLDELRRCQEDVNTRLKNLNNDAKLRVLRGAEIIGATTNAASNLLEIISAAEPVVLVVEEAGECLEAQVIANLVPSIQQLIMIGDEKQLRPQISSYHLSIDSSQGSVHRHDVSLFERLATLPVPVSMLRTQRRMRPEISSLIRTFLYPDLEDAPQVLEYPNVKGMTKNVYFIDHRLAEDSQAVDHSSKSNSQEAIWVVDLVRHLLKQGYKAGQIAVICPYLGQVSTLKRALEEETIAVAIDERDAEDLAAAREKAREGNGVEEEDDFEDEPESEVPVQAELKSLKSQIDLRTIDRFQGEEADIVILSLVRNSASLSQDDEPTFFNLDRAAKSSIGFLKSFNRTNVAISRAKHGMYLFGDATLLSEKSKMWKSVVGELEEQDLVGPHLPVGCENHPEKSLVVNCPGRLMEIAPEGGCLEPCDANLPCSHRCTRLCHVSDREHRTTRCTQRCAVLLECSHPCNGLCSEPHPKCTFNIARVPLDCGHTLENVHCFIANGGVKIQCSKKDTNKFFSARPMWRKLSAIKFAELLSIALIRPARPVVETAELYKSYLEIIQLTNLTNMARLSSVVTSVEEIAKRTSNPENARTALNAVLARASTGHALIHATPFVLDACKPATRALFPARHRATFYLPTRSAQSFSSVGTRVPLSQAKTVDDKFCAPSERQGDVVDFIMFSTLGDYDENEQDPSARLITVDCSHSLSVGTLDGLFEIDEFYRKDAGGKFVGLAHPSTSDKVCVQCPSCKAPITSSSVKRYGRSLKHREITVQERLWTVRGQHIIAEATSFVDSLPKTKILDRAKNFKLNRLGRTAVPPDVARQNQRHLLKNCPSKLIPPFNFREPAFTGLPSTLQNFWSSATQPLINALYRLCDSAHSRSPQALVYEAAISQLYHEEKYRLQHSEEQVRDVDRSAIEFARQASGIAPPITDIKLQISHAWLTLDVRSTLASVAAQLAEVVRKNRSERSPTHQAFFNLATFIYKSSIRDVKLTIDGAEDRQSGRLMIEGHLRLLQLLLSYNTFLARAQLLYGSASEDAVRKSIESSRQQALSEFDLTVENFVSDQPNNKGWIDEEIWPHRAKINEQWSTVFRRIGGTVYEPVTEDELKLIIKSQDFSISSHWYTCPEGHPYAIADCGGAAMEARCGECGATIGGSGHRVASGNRHDERMIRVAESMGSRPEFPWGRQ